MEKPKLNAIWSPSWFEMDQSITVGMGGQYWFHPPTSDLMGIAENADLVFLNQVCHGSNEELRFATVAEIHHKKLGLLSRIDTAGLDYVFTTLAGEDIYVNAEEEPGVAFDYPEPIVDWSVNVILVNVSEPISDTV